MADRPRGNGGPDEGTPEYNWLYGNKGAGSAPGGQDATRAVPQQPRPDQTQVMPASPAGGTTTPTPGRTSRPTPPPIAPPPGTSGGKGRSSRFPRFRLRWIWLLVLLWVVYLVAVPLYAWTKVEKVEFEPKGARPDDQPGTTYLLVGSDSRAGLSKEQRKELSTGNAGGGRTDTIMLLHTGSGPNLLLSIPRDSIVDIPGHGTTKINAAYAYGGPKLLVQTIEQDTGVKVDDYVEIGMGGVAGIVDSVGGIEVCPKQNMKDKLAGLDIKKGCQEVDGTTALAYARSRHASATGDIDRVRRQREVVSAVGSAVLSPWSVINPVTYWKLNSAIPDFFAFGDGMGPVRSAMWATAMTRVDGDKGLTCVVPLQDLAVNWDPDKAPQMFQKIIEDDTASVGKDLCSPTGGIG